ncbi:MULTISPECIES: hypothetical protein [unclassified Moritella]|uniref:hypothetical protein n=1 Tax=unclassified Moritella TaxID=2637987 RepID=UPI001BAA0BE2|nr:MULTISPECIES: hypothetical protein [unclassified Moritella]QUM86702.1 hypothetical protein HWV02_20410 [Moritella sp. 28]QUM90929.1 hypothetical protein HWV03_20090 [Moritella sp. 36]
MKNNLIISSEVIALNSETTAAWDIWCNAGNAELPSGAVRKCYYLEENENHFLELIAVEKFSDLETLMIQREAFMTELSPLLSSDIRQQVFQLEDTVKAIDTALPTTEKLQLRYIEVPLSVKDAYLNWREDTIFEVVRGASQIDCFLAYRTLFSTQPGVMFFSGFNGDSSQYMADIFLTPKYQQIVKEAGDQYITGGADGLYTRIFVAA